MEIGKCGADAVLMPYGDKLLMVTAEGVRNVQQCANNGTYSLMLMEDQGEGQVVRLSAALRLGSNVFTLQERKADAYFADWEMTAFVQEWVELARSVGFGVEMTTKLMDIYAEAGR